MGLSHKSHWFLSKFDVNSLVGGIRAVPKTLESTTFVCLKQLIYGFLDIILQAFCFSIA